MSTIRVGAVGSIIAQLSLKKHRFPSPVDKITKKIWIFLPSLLTEPGKIETNDDVFWTQWSL